MVYVDTYLTFRAAGPGDVTEILALIAGSVATGELVRRTRKEVLGHIGDYLVAVVDGNVVGTVAIHVYDPDGIAELACLYVKSTHVNQGYGRRLVAFAEKVARERGATRLVALSTQAGGYFAERCGFTPGEPSDLPRERRAKLLKSGRNSKVLLRELG
jgi:amino-acid N-acetyltransferase